MLKRLLREFRFETAGKWFIYGSIIGLVAGLGAVFFDFLLKLVQHYALFKIVGYNAPLPVGEGGGEYSFLQLVKHKWLFLFIPTLGGLISGLLVYTFAPEAEGHGTDAVIESFHRLRGIIRTRVPIIKTIASAITIGSGGSGGREGPIAQIGAGFGSYLATLLKLPDRDRRLFVLAGAGAGIGAIFRAPLGGALFIAEVLYRSSDFEAEAVMPTIIAGVIGYAIFGVFKGWHPIFATPSYIFTVKELPFFALLGVAVVPLSFVYVRMFYKIRDFFKLLKIPDIFKPAIGGLFLGFILLFLPHVGATGYGWVQLALFGKISLLLMIAIAVFKILATSLSIGSGGSGGVFGPSVVIGAMYGGFMGKLFNLLAPNTVITTSPYVLVGMASFFAAAANVPLASLVMVLEMTGSYQLLVPIAFASSIAFLLSSRWSIYEKQVTSRVDSPVHRGELIMDILQDIKVKEILEEREVPHFHPEEKVVDVLKRVAFEDHCCFPVANDAHEMIGIFYTEDLRAALYEGELPEMREILIVGDVMRTDVPQLTPDDNLQHALSLFIKTGLEELPVVDKDRKKCIGVLRRRDILNAYDRELAKRKLENEKFELI